MLDKIRMTLDSYLSVSLNEIDAIRLMNRVDTKYIATQVFNHAAIVELKQDKKTNSVIANRLRDENIRPCGMSKYCVGMLLLNKHLSYKMYKKNFVKFINNTSWNYSE